MGSSDKYSANSSRRQDPSYHDGMSKQDKYKDQRDLAREELKKELKRAQEAVAQRDQLLQENKYLIAERESLRDDNERLAIDNQRLGDKNRILENNNTGWQAKYEHLEQRYNSIKHLDTANPMSPLPDRTKKSSPSSKSSSSSTTLSGGASSSNATSKIDRAREKDRQREMRERANIDEGLASRLGGAPTGRVGRTKEMPLSYDKYNAPSRARRSSTSRTRYETSRRGSVDFSTVPRTHASHADWPGPHSGYDTAYDEYSGSRPISEMIDGNYHPH